MQRVKRPTAVAVLPNPPEGGTPGFFAAPNPLGGIDATVPGYEWYNSIQEELCAVIEASGLVLDGNSFAQLLAALRRPGVFSTAPRFTDNTMIATTEFVRKSGLQANSGQTVTGAVTLTTADVGTLVYLGGSGGYTVTLPLASGVPIGARIEIISGVAATISRQGAEAIFSTLATAGAVATMAIATGEHLTFVSNGSGWLPVGTSQLKFSTAFGASLAASGWQRLPSGLIIQWGLASGSVVTFPVAFPNSLVRVFTTPVGSAVGTLEMIMSSVYGESSTGFSINRTRLLSGSSTITTTTHMTNWLAVGN